MHHSFIYLYLPLSIKETIMSAILADLLDITLDDIEDLPSFANFPVGFHRVSLSLSTKKINEHPAIEASLVYIEAIELADPSLEPPKAGDKASLAYMMDNEFGSGKFKELAKPLAATLGTVKVAEIIEQCQNMEVIIATGLRKDKTDPTKEYMDIKELAVG